MRLNCQAAAAVGMNRPGFDGGFAPMEELSHARAEDVSGVQDRSRL